MLSGGENTWRLFAAGFSQQGMPRALVSPCVFSAVYSIIEDYD